jgi:hypothetical protein
VFAPHGHAVLDARRIAAPAPIVRLDEADLVGERDRARLRRPDERGIARELREIEAVRDGLRLAVRGDAGEVELPGLERLELDDRVVEVAAVGREDPDAHAPAALDLVRGLGVRRREDEIGPAFTGG